MHTKVLDLHDALGLWIVDLSLKVDAVDQVIVQDANLRQTRGHLELCRSRVRVDLRREQPPLAPVHGPETLVEGHDLVGAEGDPLPHEQVDVCKVNCLAQVVLDVALPRRRLPRAVRVRRHGLLAAAHVQRKVRRGDVRDVLNLGDSGHLLEASVCNQVKMLCLLLLLLIELAAELHQQELVLEGLGRVDKPVDVLLETDRNLLHKLEAPHRGLIRCDGLKVLGRELQTVEQLLLPQVVDGRLALLRDIHEGAL
mmetsp:Transcript_34532/g.67594  ORF Transcript_34532/g.67594 Transcript_34532/m.67594 type:complete len:254 (-) Transcript_34532:544-1305(-)